MLKVSALVMTRNEERYIARCLRSLEWADELIVIDANSTDRTKEIATDPTQPWSKKLRFIENPWQGFAVQRNFALKTAQNDWVVFLDADEEASPEFKAKVQFYLAEPKGPPVPVFEVKRIEYFLGKPIQHGIWNPSYQCRFYNRNGVSFSGNVHEELNYKGEKIFLEEPVHHAPDFNVERFLDKMNRYTTIEAQDRYDRGVRTNIVMLLTAFFSLSLKNYVYYGAYKDGWHGLIISLLEGTSRVVRHIKLWQLQTVSKDSTRSSR